MLCYKPVRFVFLFCNFFLNLFVCVFAHSLFVFAGYYSAQVWGFHLTATATIEEVKTDMPFLLVCIAFVFRLFVCVYRSDISFVLGCCQELCPGCRAYDYQCCAWSFAANLRERGTRVCLFVCCVVCCSAVCSYSSRYEQMHKYIDSELLSEGAEFDEKREKQEREKEEQLNTWLKVDLSPFVSPAAAALLADADTVWCILLCVRVCVFV